MFQIIFIIFVSLASAKDFSIPELVNLAQEHAPQIRSESYGLEAAEAQVRQGRLLANPFITYQGGMLRTGTQRGAVSDISLNQPIPWYGKRQARISAQEFLQKMAILTKEEMLLEVSHRVYNLAAEIAALQELISHSAERRRRFALIEQSLRTRPQASPKQRVDRDLIESQISILEKAMIELGARRESLLWELGLLSGAEINRIVFSWEKLPAEVPKENYLQQLENSPRFKRWQIETKLAANRIEQARLEARPDVMVGINYREENVAPTNRFYHGQMSIVIPIVDRGQHSVQVARAEQRRLGATHEVERNRLLSEIHQRYAELKASRKVMKVFDLLRLGTIEAKFADAESSFRKGLIDALTFLQIDSQVHENIDQIYLSRLTYLRSVSQLNLLLGKAPESL